jgi:hypothetical protein
MWQLIDNNGALIGKPTEFPPIPAEGQRLVYKVTFYQHEIPTRFYIRPLYLVEEGEAKAEAKATQELMRFAWNLKVWGGSVEEIRELTKKVVAEIEG